MRTINLVLLVTACAASGESSDSSEIFTTTEDGSVVNENHYDAKTDVYLDGGPNGGAPSHAAALPAGDYYFQVTAPNGKTVLSTDDISCRKFRISDEGVIVAVYSGVGGCKHATGIDSDDADLGAITIQLAPFADTPNNGGVYKVMVSSDPAFPHKLTKSDNFKVDASTTPPPPTPTCGDGHVDSGEGCDDGNTANNDGCSSTCVVEECPHSCPDGSHD